MAAKPPFAAIPAAAICDRRLTDLDVRVLAVIASHDRMSSLRGSGQGAWASHASMATRVGCDYTRFSVAVNRLLKLGYLERQRLATDRRKFTYRVQYPLTDSLPEDQGSPGKVGRPANEMPEIVCRGSDLSDGNDSESPSEYIPLSGGIDSAEAGERYSGEPARQQSRTQSQEGQGLGVGGNLARLERTLKAGGNLDVSAWRDWLEAVVDEAEPAEDNERYWAQRLLDQMHDMEDDE